MKKVVVKLNNEVVGVTKMTVEEIRRAEKSGFTIIENVLLGA